MQHLRNLDHIVVATSDLDATVQAFAEATGVSPVLGGVHPDQGTRNFLDAFTGGGYLEIIGIDEARPGPRVFDLHLVDAPTVATFAVHPDAPQTKLGAAYELGFDLGVLGAGQRRDPSGTLLRWRLTPPLASDHSGVQPIRHRLGHHTLTGAHRRRTRHTRRLSRDPSRTSQSTGTLRRPRRSRSG